MTSHTRPTWIAFAASRRIACGRPREVAAAVKHCVDTSRDPSPLVFDAQTSAPIDLDLRGSLAEVLERLPADTSPLESVGAGEPAARSVGRPRLGVVAREVTLLPRHWEWLASQSGGASVALRKLVEAAQRAGKSADEKRRREEAAYRFISAVAGDLAGFEEASRALFAGDLPKFAECISAWPIDLREHALGLAKPPELAGGEGVA